MSKSGIIDNKFGKEIFKKKMGPKEMWIVNGGHHIDAFIKHPEYKYKLLRKLNLIFPQH